MIKKYFVVLFIFVTINNVLAIELQPAVISKGRDTIRNQVQTIASPIITEVVKSIGPKPGRGLAYTNLGSGTNWYRLYSNLEIYGVNTETKTLLGHWPITRWSHEYIIPEITTRLELENASESHTLPSVTQLLPGETHYGCLSQIPLRFGDIDNNGSQELILLFNQDIAIFSPDSKKIIFQMNWVDHRYDGDYEDDNGPIQIFKDQITSTPQFRDPYISSHDFYKGLRSYAKFYIGEFNGNQSPDIVVWYKVYESNMPGELAGFTKVRDTVRHYELITEAVDDIQPTGEYLPLNTSETDIRQWLTSNSLTWQKGYPNLSECAGQVGQHIPEMIDPLLNDPDVLK